MTQPTSLRPPSGEASQTASVDTLHIPYEKFRLDNGLTVIVHEDRRAPRVSMEIIYRVGSKDEPVGKTGFAHLFEHLMFGGSQNVPGLFINNLLEAGASNLNGTTSTDRTNYYQTVPSCALDYALFAESDRMGHFYETINSDTLEMQRGVVQNEKLQREGAPYGLVGERISLGTYPVGHPYAHTVIGSAEDIAAATLDDVRAWFKKYYAPSNAVLCLAGDIDVETARVKVNQYFGDIPPGQPLSHAVAWVPKMTGTKREVLEDRVPQTNLFMVWNVPPFGDQDIELLGLLARMLSDGVSSRLSRRLVLEDKLASGVNVGVSPATLCSQFTISVTVRAGADIPAVERAVHEELHKLRTVAASPAEVERVRTRELSGFLNELEQLPAIAHMLAMSEVRTGEPNAHEHAIAFVRAATGETIRTAAERWLSDGVYVLTVRPFPAFKAAATGVDRSIIPVIGEPRSVKLPPLQRDTLSNGIRIILATQPQLPLVRCSMVFETGMMMEPSSARGSARLMNVLLGRGSGGRDALAFSEATQRLGASIGSGMTPEWTGCTVSSLKAELDRSLELFADYILRPRFDAADVERERIHAIEQIAHEVSSPGAAVGRLLPGLMYPAGHVYARPLSGTGLVSEINSITRDDIVRLHAEQFSPSLATIIVVGDTTLERIKPLLEKHFGHWTRSTRARRSIAAPTPPRPGAAVHLVHKPGVSQAIVSAATLFPPMHDPVAMLPMSFMNTVLGGGFTSRINMNLREDKHWSYGAGTSIARYRGSQLYFVSAPVQIDRTADAMAEMRNEFAGIVGSRPVTPEELDRAKRQACLSFGANFGTLSGIAGAIEHLVQERLPDEFFEGQIDRMRALTLSEVNEAARDLIVPNGMVWTVAGDLDLIGDSVRALDLGPVSLHEADGESLYTRGL